MSFSHRITPARRKLLGLAAGIFLFALPAPSDAGNAAVEVRGTIEKIQSLLQDGRSKRAARKNDRQMQLRQVLDRRFDFAEMAKRSLGSHWQGRSAPERVEFVKLFSDIFAGAFADQLDPYLAEKFVYLRETRDGDFSEVETKILPARGSEFAITYKLRSERGDWKVYDVVVENVSIVNNFRSQFNRVLGNASFDDLLKRLRETRTKLLQAKRERPDATMMSYWILAQASSPRPR